MKKKIALIFGVTGQDGSYLSSFLLTKKYIVHGVKRRSSSINTSRVDHIYQDPQVKNRNFILHYGDVTDTLSVSSIIKKVKPDFIFFFEISINNFAISKLLLFILDPIL